MRNTLVSTVGTSLLGNIRGRYNPDLGVKEEQQQVLQKHLANRDFGQLAREFTRIDPSARICGAEINSITEAVKRSKVQLENISFLVSDTDDGKFVGQFLEAYLIERGIEGLRTVTYTPIEDLQDDKPARFKTYGLRNLVRELGKLVNKHSAQQIVIDATGGYKAQIAVAVVFGQALEIPVLYRHERFSEIIEFPPMPITFQYDLIGKNSDLLTVFERGDALTLSELEEVDDKLRVFLEEVEVEGETLFELGSVGQIILTGFRLRFPRAKELQPVLPSQKSIPSFREDNFPIGFKDFVLKMCEDVAWIKTAHSLPYSGQKAIQGKLRNGAGFYVREGKLIGSYQDSNNFGARFEILTDATGEDQLTWAADQLNQKYLRG
jgi:putative CRISPR-associated protein (TIGR02619 family)